jgi:hypothetical protein
MVQLFFDREAGECPLFCFLYVWLILCIYILNFYKINLSAGGICFEHRGHVGMK